MAQFIRYINYMGLGRDLIDWNPEEFCGYKPKTTYYSDFSIAEPFGESAIMDTFNRALENWSTDIEFMTEIVMVCNWKIFEHYDRNDELAELYDGLYRRADEFVRSNFDGDDLDYYYRTTD